MEKYFAVEDRNRRLHRTICLLGSEPVHVLCNDPQGNILPADDEVLICPLPDAIKGRYFKIKYTDPSFQARAFPLGYINHSNGASYIGRVPQQQQRQGLHSDQVENLGGDPLPFNWLLSQEMSDCIKGVHPSFDEACLHVSKTGAARAFDRFWAVAPHHRSAHSLQYRGRSAGFIVSNRITLFKSKEDRILRSLLSEKGLTINDYSADNTRNPQSAPPY
jgi:hypothetical protein